MFLKQLGPVRQFLDFRRFLAGEVFFGQGPGRKAVNGKSLELVQGKKQDGVSDLGGDAGVAQQAVFGVDVGNIGQGVQVQSAAGDSLGGVLQGGGPFRPQMRPGQALRAGFQQPLRSGKGIAGFAVQGHRVAQGFGQPLDGLGSLRHAVVGGAEESNQALPGFLAQQTQPPVFAHHHLHPPVVADFLINGGCIVLQSEVVLQVELGHSLGQSAAELDPLIGLAHSDEVALHHPGKPAVRGILFPGPAESLAAEQGELQVEGLAAGIQFH